MGAFLLVRNKLINTNEFNTRLDRALDIFSDKLKLPLSGKFILNNYTLYIYNKRFYESTNFVEYENGDFIASTGSLFYAGKCGDDALKIIYQEFIRGRKIENSVRGQFFILIKYFSDLIIFRDYNGVYPIYIDKNYNIVSSSFHVCAILQENLTISKDELYEYILNGYWHSKQTFFEEISLLPTRGYLNLSTSQYNRFYPDFTLLPQDTYSRMLTSVTETLCEYFMSLYSAFKEIRTGLSGGYDSRLVLACLIGQGVRPSLYVNGTPGSIDIQCAKSIAEGLRFNIEEINYYNEYNVPVHERRNLILNRFYNFGGLGVGGLFDIYSDIEYRLNNPSINNAVINGGGGEMYREAWNLPNKNISIESFVKTRYDKLPFNDILKNYSGYEYLTNIKNKIIDKLEINSSRVKRIDIEKLYRSRHQAVNFLMSTQQQLYPYIMPFCEPFLIEQSLQIPLRYKYRAKFNKDLIKIIYPELSRFMSVYGYNFDKKVPLKYTLSEFITINTPLRLRPYVRRFKKTRKLPVKKYGKDLLDPSFVRSILPEQPKRIEEYIKISEVDNDGVKSRALTLEILLRDLDL